MGARISDAEWSVLRILWEQHEMSSADVVTALQKTTNWQPTTIRTLLSRLVKKRVIGFRTGDSGYLYFPLVTEADCAAAERRSFFQKVYRGDPRSMFSAFLTEERLTPEDLDALQKLLDDRKSSS